MRHLREKFDASERQVCRALRLHRSTIRYRAVLLSQEGRRLLRALHRLAKRHPRFGYRRLTALLRRQHWAVNRKRIRRLCIQEGLRVPLRRRQHRRLGRSENGCAVTRATHRQHVWTYDFVSLRLSGGGAARVLSVLDEHTRECLALHAARSIKGADVIGVLAGVMATRGEPEFMRSDNGPEFIAHEVKRWLLAVGTRTLYIAPGSPWENGFVESFHSRLRDELLNRAQIETVLEARVALDQFRDEYNHERPHSSLRYLTPAEFAARCPRLGSATLRRGADSAVPSRPARSSSLARVP